MIIPCDIQSERLVLRCPTAADGPAIHAAIIASWPELSQWMQWTSGGLPTLAQTTARAASRAEAFAARTACVFAGFERTSQTLVGLFALQDFDWSVPRGELGGWLVTAQTGRGYAHEMVSAMTRVGSAVGMRRIEWRCDVDNARSRAVAERTGFTLEGIMRQHTLTPQGSLRDTCLYAQVF